jgi:hypothetical protein
MNDVARPLLRPLLHLSKIGHRLYIRLPIATLSSSPSNNIGSRRARPSSFTSPISTPAQTCTYANLETSTQCEMCGDAARGFSTCMVSTLLDLDVWTIHTRVSELGLMPLMVRCAPLLQHRANPVFVGKIAGSNRTWIQLTMWSREILALDQSLTRYHLRE